MEFKINDSIWAIEETDEANINYAVDAKYILGATVYKEQKILLLKGQANIIKTLKHELTHVWLNEYGHNQHEKEFNCEDVCEIVANINNFINEIVEAYETQIINKVAEKLQEENEEENTEEVIEDE